MSTSEEALHEQREWLHFTLSSIGDAVITADNQNFLNFLNPVAQSLTGWTQKEAVGVGLETVFQIVNKDTRLTLEHPATRALRDGLVVELSNHTLLKTKDGTKHPIEGNAAPVRNAKGEAVGVVLVFRDITKHQLAASALRVSEIRYRRLFEAAKDGILILDPYTRQITDANPFMTSLLDYRREEMIGKELFEIGLLKDEKASQEAFRELRENNYIRYEDLPLESKSGQRREVEVVANLYEEDGRPVIPANIRDITERKQAENALEVSESRYRRLFETAQDAILILDASTGVITDANPFIKEMLGYTHDDIIGKELWQLGFFQDKTASQTAFKELQESGYIRFDHLPLETKSGQQVEVEFVSNVYEVDHTQVIQCNIRDITKRSRMERQIREQTETLADLHRRKDEFLAMLSHELRNPLSPILNAVHVLKLERSDNPLQQQARMVIERQVGQLTHLINDLLEISRFSTGRIQLQLQLIDIRPIVKLAVESVQPLIARRKHILSISLPAEPIWLHADSSRMEQVVVNLLNNAAKYTDEGGQIWLSVEQEGDQMALRVRDSGVGIAPELLPHIFDLFAQADHSLDRSQGGLGIGLSLVEKIVGLHRGTVEAYSEGLGKGSEFTLRLPVLPSPATELPASTLETAAPSLVARRVLVVDDNVDSADMVALVVQESGYEVRAAYTGQTALDAAIAYQPNIVLLDIGLPDMNGYDVAQQLRQHPQLKDARLIAITGYGQESDRQRSHDAGFDYHLVKPVHPQILQDLLSMLSAQERRGV